MINECAVEDWKNMWERADNGNENVRYHPMWSKDGLGEDETFDTLAELRAAFRKECPLRLIIHKDADESANVPVVPEPFYQKYLNDDWYDYDSCNWVNKAWAGDYVPRIPTGAYFSDLNGYARNITPTGRLGQTYVKFT